MLHEVTAHLVDLPGGLVLARVLPLRDADALAAVAGAQAAVGALQGHVHAAGQHHGLAHGAAHRH